MKAFVKPAIILGMAGAVALGSMTAAEARVRPGVAGAAGFAAGVAVGAAANSRAYGYYGPGYRAYGYAPGYRAYGYAPGYGAYGASPYGYDGGYRSYGFTSDGRPLWEERRLEGIE